MNEIVAALIIACSNLTHGDMNVDASRKSECIHRVAKCANENLKWNSDELTKTRIALQCAKEVYR